MAKDANGNEIPDGALPGSLGGWAKQAVMGGPPQATVPVSEVPGIVARAPGAYASAVVDSAKHDLGVAPTAAVPPGDAPEVTIDPGAEGDMRSHEATLEGLRAEMLMQGALVGDNTKAPPRFYQDAGEDYSRAAGRRGKELFNRAYGDGPDDGPTRLQAAVRESEVAQTQKNEAMAKFYDGEAQRATSAAATRKMAMEQDAAELRQRQAKMEQATQFYTDDLNNKGAFWSKPENIVAAISFSLMPIFSSDPSIGVKLVNQAIQQDLEHRRASAGMVLGALRSNLDGYHKIVGDRQAGDQLAEAEARRVAALEVERIGAKFESPISKAKTEFIAQNLRNEALKGYMSAYGQAKIFHEAKVTDPGLYAHRTKGYEGAWASLNVPDVAPIQTVGAAVNGSVKGSPSLAGSGGGYTSHVAPEVKGMLRGGVPASVAARLALEGRVPGSANMYTMLESYVNKAAISEPMAKGLNYGPGYMAAKGKVFKDAQDEIAKVPGLEAGPHSFAGVKATLSDLIASAEIIRARETADGRNPEKFLGKMRVLTGNGFANKYEEFMRAFASEPVTEGEKREKAMNAAVQAFRQKLSSQIASHYNRISGGNITNNELPRLEASISGSSDFGFAYNWLKNKSIEVQDQEKTAVQNRLSPLAAMIYMTRTGVGQRPHGLPVREKPGPAKPPEGKGEYNAPMSKSPGSGYSSYKSGE